MQDHQPKLCENVQRGYLQEASLADDVHFSPLLLVMKPNGAFRFTTDFRELNNIPCRAK